MTNIMAGPNYRDVDDEVEDWLARQDNPEQQPEVVRTLLIHKADNGPEPITGTPGDVTINITDLAGEPAYQVEGAALAEALWDALPAATVVLMMRRLRELSGNVEN